MTSLAEPAAASRLERNLALEMARVTEAAALAASLWMGKGDERGADLASVEAMQRALNSLAIQGTIVIGDGDQETSPMLYTGEAVGTGDGPRVDIALDPLEGATICATGGANALAVIACAEHGGFLKVPGIYMDKIAVGGGLPEGVVDLDVPVEKNLASLAEARGSAISDLLVCILNRPRHEELIARVREAGARIMLISDGDVSGVVATAMGENGPGVDLYLGSGGAPEGVLAAAALRCIGGQMQGRLICRNDADRALARACGITDFNRKYTAGEMAQGDVMFAATGITDGAMLQGVRRRHGGARTHSLVMRSKSGTIRWIEASHNFLCKDVDGAGHIEA